MPDSSPPDPHDAFARLDLGPAIPPPLQRAVAATLAWLIALDREAAAGPPPPRDPTPPR
jgi:type III secretion system FlhB-like substrate exporter